MKKKLMSIITIVCLFTFMTGNFVFASTDQFKTEEDIAPAALPQITSKTVTDDHGNKYKVVGMSSIVGKRADVHTEFEVTFYKGGKKDPVNNYTKKITGTGRVWFSGAAGDNQFTKSKSLTGASGVFVASDSYDFLIRTLHSTHKFSCQGGSTSFYTEM